MNAKNQVPVTPTKSPSGNLGKGLAAGIDRLSGITGTIAGIILFGAALVMAYEAIMRRVFDSPTVWAYSVSLFILMWFTLLAAPLVIRDNRHIAADFFVSFFSERVQSLMRIIGYILGLIFLFCIGYYGFWYMMEALRIGRTSIELLRYPMWILLLILPITGILHFLQIPKNLADEFKLIKSADIDKAEAWKDYLVMAIFCFLLFLSIYLFTVNPAVAMAVLCLSLLFAGIPVYISLGFTGIAAFFIVYDQFASLRIIPVIAEDTLHNYVILAIPLFVMGGMILHKCGVGEAIYDFSSKWLSGLPGGLAVGTIGAATLMSAMVGVTSAVAAAVGMIAIPSLTSRGYPKGLAYGSVGGGAIGILFPPSAALIVYGFLTHTSVGTLFAAALLPALIVVGLFVLYIVSYCSITKQYTIEEVTWNERWSILVKVFPALLAPVIVLGGIYGGWFTPTEAAGILVLYSFLISFLYTRMNWERLKEIVHESAVIGSVILMIILGGKVLGQVIAHLRLPRIATEWLLAADISITLVVAGLFILYIILGLFLDGVTITLLTVPVIHPMLPELGINVVVFGVLLMILIEMAHITPPVGLNLFMIKSVTNDNLWVISKGHIPFTIILLIAGIILYFFPQLALWFPEVVAA